MSALLLDTRVVLWALGDVQNLSPAARDALADGSIPANVSAASIWEISVKRATGKLKAPDDLLARIADASFDSLPIDQEHAYTAGALPLHHRDPFDRMLIAQAKLEAMPIISADRIFTSFALPVVWDGPAN